MPNNTINSGSEKWRAFVAPLFTAGYGERLDEAPSAFLERTTKVVVQRAPLWRTTP